MERVKVNIFKIESKSGPLGMLFECTTSLGSRYTVSDVNVDGFAKKVADILDDAMSKADAGDVGFEITFQKPADIICDVLGNITRKFDLTQEEQDAFWRLFRIEWLQME